MSIHIPTNTGPKKLRPSRRRIPPVVLAVGAGCAQAVIARKSHHSWPSTIAAGALAQVSAGLLLSSIFAFRKQGTTVDPLAVERANSLVTTGAFGLTRNPMYVALAGLLLAHAVFWRSWAACIPAGVFVALIDQIQIPAEERALREQFGQGFAEYIRRTPRWLDGRSLGTIRPQHY